MLLRMILVNSLFMKKRIPQCLTEQRKKWSNNQIEIVLVIKMQLMSTEKSEMQFYARHRLTLGCANLWSVRCVFDLFSIKLWDRDCFRSSVAHRIADRPGKVIAMAGWMHNFEKSFSRDVNLKIFYAMKRHRRSDVWLKSTNGIQFLWQVLPFIEESLRELTFWRQLFGRWAGLRRIVS